MNGSCIQRLVLLGEDLFLHRFASYLLEFKLNIPQCVTSTKPQGDMDKEGKMMIFLLLMAGNIITHFNIIRTCTPLKGALCSCRGINLDQREKSAFIDFYKKNVLLMNKQRTIHFHSVPLFKFAGT